MKNDFKIIGDTTIIYLNRRDGTQLECLVDTEDLEKTKEVPTSWWADKSSDGNGFYVCGEIRDGEKRIKVRMHRFLTNTLSRDCVDHKNHNKLDNRKDNLRVVTHAENHQNREKAQSNSKTGIRGVGWHKHAKKYYAYMVLDGKRKSLGYYDDIGEAERVAIEARREHMPYYEG